jgi:predicted nucleic acid-binding protein
VTVVLDADVVIGALDGNDRHHADARKLFVAWQAEGTARLLSLVNLTEILIGPSGDPRRLHTAREAIAALGITVHAPTEAIAVDAARARREHPISLPDAYALATARQVDGRLATFDQWLLKIVSSEGLA